MNRLVVWQWRYLRLLRFLRRRLSKCIEKGFHTVVQVTSVAKQLRRRLLAKQGHINFARRVVILRNQRREKYTVRTLQNCDVSRRAFFSKYMLVV
jgi:hypothetical protein